MEPVNFAESNKNLLPPPGMKDCIELRVWTDGERCISLWKLTWLERLQVLIWGRMWLVAYSGATQPPVWLMPDRTVFVKPAPGPAEHG